MFDPAMPLLTRVQRLAAPQDGCVATAQLTAAGIGDDTIASLVSRGAITRTARGAYVVGAETISQRQLLRTALLLAGPAGVISHESAAALHGLLPEVPGEASVTAPGQRRERIVTTDIAVTGTGRPGTIRIYGCRRDLRPWLVDTIASTTVADTLVALAGAGEAGRLTAAWREADYRNKLRASAVDGAIGRGIAGSTVMRDLMNAHPIVSDDATDVQTRGEFLLLEACLAIGLPRPLTNAPLSLPGRTYFPDQHYVPEGLIVEADGGVHKRRRRRESDRARDAHMNRHGLEVLRIPDEDIDADAIAAARRVEARLIARRNRGR